jgi:hypothetical protein
MENKEKFTVQKFSSFEEAEKADKEMRRKMNMQERMNTMLQLRNFLLELKYGTTEGFQRVYSVTKRKRS